ncbi:hypothetical protein LO763_02435 [Glycomyces sp. A-F 0318]|uniref:hypothetical protein n=1 Tax=Glycomyces amatae TaxID=2881355 RepID=UPI001E326BDC|nr:hypothetical protein [Glycomyces amatae]MCD0442482.1 hypothetical protein [Glycomyces amatae]
MTALIAAADLAAEMFAADERVEYEVERLRARSRSEALAALFAAYLPAHLPPLRLSCRIDFHGQPRLSAVPTRAGTDRAYDPITAFAAWVADQDATDYTVRINDEHDQAMLTAHLTLAGLPVTLRLFVWSWETDLDAVADIVAEAVTAARTAVAEVAA